MLPPPRALRFRWSPFVFAVHVDCIGRYWVQLHPPPSPVCGSPVFAFKSRVFFVGLCLIRPCAGVSLTALRVPNRSFFQRLICFRLRLLPPPALCSPCSPLAHLRCVWGRQRRFASALVVADHDNAAVSAGTLSAITAAQKLGGATVLVAGHGCGKAAEHAGTTFGWTRWSGWLT